MNTPCFRYDTELLAETLHHVLAAAESRNYFVHYAIKANSNPEILKEIKEAGLGADCVSGNEIKWAIEAGFDAENIVFAGVGKTDFEIEYAVKNQIGIIHCEGFQEILAINEIAKQNNRSVKVALRLNPNINANTHQKITTGLTENKFGFSIIELNKLVEVKAQLNFVEIIGLHFHIGSQILDMNIFKALAKKVNEYESFFEANFGSLSYLNLGGGLGINYQHPDEDAIPNFEAYFSAFHENLNSKTANIHFELGRSIVGQCGKLYTKVLFIKESENKKFAVVDAGMTELLRPALYDAYHQISYNGISLKSNRQPYDIVGPICESSDCLGKNYLLPELRRGDILVVKSCGAYAESMRLSYNGRLSVPAQYI